MGYGYVDYGYGYEPDVLGIDVTDGDLVENFGGGFGIDLMDSDLEFEVAPGMYIDLG